MTPSNTHRHYQSTDAARERARAALSPRPAVKTGTGWDRFVAAMRLLLPLAALILGGVTALWPMLNDREVSFTLARDEVAASDGKVRMTDLTYTGTDAVDRLFTLQAARGVQDNPGAPRVSLEDIRARMSLKPDDPARLTAKRGIYMIREDRLTLSGTVDLSTGSGYHLSMLEATVNLKDHSAVGRGAITGTAPLGRLTADRLAIDVDDRSGVFSGDVRLHITPKRPPDHSGKSEGTNG
ncbi:LPS export ABC transporter periplasmic protein LptC [Yunchengibacter salinarum]|uniref:LPS export ABC transporter periplasmic protein LptC n=1 Tax=Yunchengibacter salinarum TaxID=3133399 RepID=UPI0035B62B38